MLWLTMNGPKKYAVATHQRVTTAFLISVDNFLYEHVTFHTGWDFEAHQSQEGRCDIGEFAGIFFKWYRLVADVAERYERG